MLFPKLLDCREARGVASNGLAEIDLDLGEAIRGVRLEGYVSGDATKLIDDIVDTIEILVNGKAQREAMSWQFINYLNQLNDSALAVVNVGDTVAGLVQTKFSLPILFSEIFRFSSVLNVNDGPNFYALRTGLFPDGRASVNTVTIRVKLKELDNIRLSAWQESFEDVYEISPGKFAGRPLESLVKWEKKQVQVTGTAVVINEMGVDTSAGLIQVLSLFEEDFSNFTLSADTKITLYANNVKLWERSKPQLDRLLINHGMVPSQNHLSLVFDYQDIFQSGFNTRDRVGNPITKLRLEMTLNSGTARNLIMIVQRWGAPVA